MKFVALGAAASVALFSTPVQAQDAASSFDGPRIEARVGWDGPQIRGTISDGVNRISRKADKTGVVYGGEIGYDHALRNVVIGAYAGLEESSAKECGELYGEDRLCLRAGRNITGGVRIGTPVGDQFMLYGKGGYSNGRVTVDYRDYELILADIDEGRNFDGFHVGGGVEGTLSGRVYGRLEYVYTSYGKVSATLDDATASLKPTRHQVAYAMGLRF